MWKLIIRWTLTSDCCCMKNDCDDVIRHVDCKIGLMRRLAPPVITEFR